MSSTALPTKPYGERPPIFPPTHTAFDGAPGDESWLAWFKSDVRKICRLADASEGEDLSTMVELLEGRRRIVVQESLAETALSDLQIPPVNGMNIDFLVSRSREQFEWDAMVSQLEDCIARCKRRLSRYRFEVRLSHDLGTSDS